VRNQRLNAKIAAGEDVIMFYDGDNLIAYNSRKHSFSSEFGDDLQPLASVNQQTGQPQIRVGTKLFELDPLKCYIRDF
jgi:hypothetical protein